MVSVSPVSCDPKTSLVSRGCNASPSLVTMTRVGVTPMPRYRVVCNCVVRVDRGVPLIVEASTIVSVARCRRSSGPPTNVFGAAERGFLHVSRHEEPTKSAG